jgi:transcriptional regulator with XRE-family HTH domain
MIWIDELKGRMKAKNFSQEMLAKRIGMAPRTLSLKLKKGVFGSDEIDKMIEVLEIKDPAIIFLHKY